ncbi:MAG TPA: hypothetical protein PL110_11045 [Candidatus Eremiobacteraeota bacterium]|nr:hypothetical protein [Candidatus Eremiobacteraeota bacterium]
MFFNRKTKFFEQFNLSPLLSWKGFFHFEDIFLLAREDLLDLYYSIPEESFAVALKNTHIKYRKILFAALPGEDRKNLQIAIEKSSGNVYRAKKDIEKEFKDSLFLHKEIACSRALTKKKRNQIVNLIYNISGNYFNKEQLNILKNIPFWISAKIMELLPYSITLKYLELLEGGNILSTEPIVELPSPFISSFIEEENLPEEFLKSPFLCPVRINFSEPFIFNINKGRSFLASEDYTTGMIYLSKASRLSPPDDFLANWSYAISLYETGHREEASYHYHIALQKKSLLNKYHLFKAYSLKTGGHMRKAIDELKMLTALAPEYKYGFKLLGHIYMIREEFTKAIDSFNYSLKLFENDIYTHLEIIDGYIAQGEMHSAEEIALKAINFCKENSQKGKIYFKLGEIYQLKDKEKAKEFYEKSLELHKDYYPSLTALGLLELTEGNKEAGRNLLKKSLEIEARATWIRKTLAEHYLETGEADLALTELTAITELFPEDSYASSKIKEIRKNIKREK